MDRNFWILYFFPLFCFLVEIYGVLMRKVIKANIIDIEGERGKIKEDGSICLFCACGILHEMIQYFLFMENGGVSMSNIQFYGFEDKTRLSFYNHLYTIVLHMAHKECISFCEICSFPYNILIFVTAGGNRGESFISMKDEHFHAEMKAGHYYFIPSEHAAEYHIHPDVEYFTFHVGLEIFQGVDAYNRSSRCCEGTVGKETISQLEEIWHDSNEGRQAFRLRYFLMKFFIEHWPEHTQMPREIPDWLERLLGDLQNRCSAATSVEELAEGLHMNVDVFSRAFKKYLHVTPKKFITNILLQKVNSLLSDPSITLRMAAQQLKFSSEFYLSRFVRKHTGLSPSVYRKQISCIPNRGACRTILHVSPGNEIKS